MHDAAGMGECDRFTDFLEETQAAGEGGAIFNSFGASLTLSNDVFSVSLALGGAGGDGGQGGQSNGGPGGNETPTGASGSF